MSITDRLISKAKEYFGRDREQRERSISPSEDAEKNFPSYPHAHEDYLECSFCGRKMLVSVVLLGISHNAGMTVDCHECLKVNGINPEYAKERPENAARIQRWLDDDVLGNPD